MDSHILLANGFAGTFEQHYHNYLSINLYFFIILLIKVNRKFGSIFQIINNKITTPLKKYLLNYLDDVQFSSEKI